MSYGFLRAAAVSPCVTVADCEANAEAIIDAAEEACDHGAQLLVFPELCITGYTCGDLFEQRTLQESAVQTLKRIAQETMHLPALLALGLPFAHKGALYNTAALVFQGKVLALIPKTFIPTYSEFYERRQFAPAFSGIEQVFIDEDNAAVPFGQGILLRDSKNPLFVLGVELCEDVWTAVPPSNHLALSGATVIANLSASNEIIGKDSYRRLLIASQSAKTCAAYVYANAGNGESTTDMVFSGHNIIAENGTILSESALFSTGATYADIDLERLDQERKRTTTFADSAQKERNDKNGLTTLTLSIPLGFDRHPCDKTGGILRTIAMHPFVPENTRERTERSRAVIELQAQGLAKRLRHTHAKTAVIGLSGGLDSTLALLVTERAFALAGIPLSGVQAVTMPCFGTTGRTLTNARRLAEETGATLLEIPIAAAVRQHFADIGQDEAVHDVTYENCQARERTQVLMDIANKNGGLVIGTGDLSEQALGWATYNGDHMSMYGVNASIPKTLVRYLVEWFSQEAESKGKTALAAVLKDILDTPVSPELLPPEGENIAQQTENIVGPYELHDFFLYYVLRFGFTPKKIFYLAQRAFITQPKLAGEDERYSKADIKKWLVSFYRRFFAQQFKRSCMPDGAKVGTVNLSPRGDWRMPSDASANLWLAEAERL
ncbi:MAG: NAD(+) synthase [Treponema sp.]|nr:NAD(+) synthase [Treponema sp.]